MTDVLKTPIERIPDRRDHDYFYCYKNLDWRPIPSYKRFLNFVAKCLYFMTGPKFVVPILGIVPKT